MVVTLSGYVLRWSIPAAILAVLALACGGDDGDAMYDSAPAAIQAAAASEAEDVAYAAAATQAVYETDDVAYEEAVSEAEDVAHEADSMAASEPPAGATASRSSAGAERQLVIRADLGLEVNDVDAAARTVEATAESFGGWVDSTELAGEGGFRFAWMNLRVPSDRVTEALTALRRLGRVVDERVSSTDVTAQVVDVDARLLALRTQETRLLELLGDAETVADVIEIEDRLANVRTEIERLDATKRNLADQVATALIGVRLSLPGRFVSEPPYGFISIAVSDPSEAADALRARAESLGGYAGERREYHQGEGEFVVEMTFFVKPADLRGLMNHAATLGVVSHRDLTAIGEAPPGETPDALLRAVMSASARSDASIRIEAGNPSETAESLSDRAESLGGYVESFHENRDGGDHTVSLTLLVKAPDLRDLLDYAATLGDTGDWSYAASGRQAPDQAPNARLTVIIEEEDGDALALIILLIVLAAVLAGATLGYLFVKRRRARRRAAEAEAAAEAERGEG